MEECVMARRNEHECAFCAEELTPEQAVIGQDWKVYCSTICARRGEELSIAEVAKLMQHTL
jgi:hypothetical protein